MSSVSQTIPNYIFGINEQPDYLKRPGQVRDSLNMTPDVTKGLIKRPGSRFVCHVEDDTDGKWFNYYRSDAEQYIGHIQNNGFVRVWNVDGTVCTVTQLITDVSGTATATTDTSTHENYLTNTSEDQLQTLTVNDYTFISNRERTCAYNATVSATPPNEGIIELKVIAYGRNYTVDIKNSSGASLGQATVNTTADSTVVIDSDTILTNLKGDIDAITNMSCTQIGNVLHVVNSSESFTLETSDVTLLSVFTDQVNNVERLPYQCHHGYVTKIVNSNSEEDDYYAVFQGKDDVDGSGVWQETVGWNRNVNANTGAFVNYTGINTTLDPTTMPHVLICTAANTFTVAAADGTTPNANTAMSYSTRDVGDLNTNPTPSFVGSTINQMMLFRNRLTFLSGENVVMTTSGGLRPVNFFSTSALTSLVTDPIDISAASKQPAILWDGLEVNNGFLLFAENQQYLMTTDSDLLTQETTKLNSIGYYPYSRACTPFSLGTTIGFIDNNGSHFRMFEMSNITRDSEPTVIEQTKPVSRITTNNVIKVADSRDSSIILFATDETGSEDIVWGYRYFQNGPERQLSSWFKWQLSGNVLYHCIMRDRYYAVVRYENNNKLIELDLQDTTDTAFITHDSDVFQVHLDNRTTVASGSITFNSGADESTFTMPQNQSANILDPVHKDISAYVTAAGDNLGRYEQVTVNGNTCTLSGDWSGEDLQLGYRFNTNVTIPQFYLTKPEGQLTRSNTRASLIVHRLFMETGSIGDVEYTLERVGKDNFTGTIEAAVFDKYDLNDPALSESLRTYIPVYERNTNIVLKLHSEHPSPFSLFSISWEGDVSNRYYQSA